MIPNSLTKKQIQSFQKKILDWFVKNKRDLPWRRDRDPYHILVSEVMLQQTPVQRVIPKYNAWIERFPDLLSLASAQTREVYLYWSGLGYNRRALYIQKCAQIIVSMPGKSIPPNEKLLLQLPGIGEYTASAFLCFVYDKQISVIDVNVKKVISIYFFHGIIPDKKVLAMVAKQLLPIGKAYEWNQALMDFSSVEMKRQKIPLPRQSKFKDSDRYYRGRIIKLLLSKESYTVKEFVAIFDQPIERIENILRILVQEELLIEVKKSYILRNHTAK